MTSKILVGWAIGLFLLPGVPGIDHDTRPKETPSHGETGIGDNGLLWKRMDSGTDRPKVLLYFPTLVQGAAVIYNLPEVHHPLCITGETLADIYSGRITRWSDNHIAATNPNVRFPNARIQLVNQADENGMSLLLSRYLTQTSRSWAALTGTSAHPTWPAGQSVHTERQMIAKVQATPYAVGFADFYSVRDRSASRAAIQNRAGSCQMPSLESLAAAATTATPDLQFQADLDAIDSAAPGAYPITGFSGLIVPSYEKSDKKMSGMADLLRYILTDGQKLAADSGYVALPPRLAELELQALCLLRPR